MVYTETTVSAGELAARARDVPNLVPHNVLENYVTVPQWRVSGSWASGTNIADNTNSPVWRAYDRQANSQTTCTSVSGQTEVSFICDLTAGATSLHTLDSVFILGHNFHSLGGNLEVDLDIANNNAFSSGLLTLAVWLNPTTSLRLGSQNFRSASNRYTGVQWLRLRIRKTSGSFSSTTPAFAELWVGRRRQLSHFPKIPFDEQSMASDFVDHLSDGGIRSRYRKNKGQRIYDATWRPDGDDGTGLDEGTELRSWWNDCAQGTKPTIFVESPFNVSVTVGESASIVYNENERFYMPKLGPFLRETTLNLVESAPFLQAEL